MFGKAKKLLISVFLVFACASSLSATITLVGEIHGNENIYNEEINLYRSFYKNGGRHYFMEIGYNTAQLLNFWMNRDDDELLKMVHSNWRGTLSGGEATYNFLVEIKKEFPETIFHGIDVEHQYETNGLIYLNYLERNGLQGSRRYNLAVENLEQGKQYKKKNNSERFREKCLTENFIREYENLNGKDVFGIFGSSHTSKDTKIPGGVATLGMNLIKKGLYYYEYDLSGLAWIQIPYEILYLRLNGKIVEAGYFGTQDLHGFKGYDSRDFYLLRDTTLEELQKDSIKLRKTSNYLPQSNYPMKLEPGCLYVIDYYYLDGTMESEIHYCDGKKKQGQLITVQLH